MTNEPVALVTGASSAIGELTAGTLARRGVRVFAGVPDPAGRNAGPAERLRTGEVPVRVVELDVTDDDSVTRAVRLVLDETGRIDVAINNAGTMSVGVTEAFTIAQARDQLDVNVLGAARVNRAVLPGMRERRSGLLVHVSSLSGRVVLPTHEPDRLTSHAARPGSRPRLRRRGEAPRNRGRCDRVDVHRRGRPRSPAGPGRDRRPGAGDRLASPSHRGRGRLRRRRAQRADRADRGRAARVYGPGALGVGRGPRVVSPLRPPRERRNPGGFGR